LSKKYVLISVWDKEGLGKLASTLEKANYTILSTGGTQKFLKSKGISVTPVEDVTSFPEILNGRVKTLHPAIHGGILADRTKKEHMNDIASKGITPIDFIICNLYPFKRVLDEELNRVDSFSMENTQLVNELVENIDIGGVALLRAGAKNFKSVTVICDPKDYDWITERIENNQEITLRERLILAVKAFKTTAAYDTIISTALNTLTLSDVSAISDSTQGNILQTQIGLEDNVIFLNQVFTPRYGENPHQHAYVYSKYSSLEPVKRPNEFLGLLGFEQLQGKQLSYNNILDTQVAAELAASLSKTIPGKPAAVLLKHQIPCGVAIGDTPKGAFKKAFAGDPVSPFGGIFAFNTRVDSELAKELVNYFLEVLIAPAIEPEALQILSKKKNLRILIGNLQTLATHWDIKNAGPIILIQEADKLEEQIKANVVTKRKPTASEMKDLLFAYNVSRMIKSNGIVLVNELATVGIGSGQPNRVGALELALHYQSNMENPPNSFVMASDGFFPFSDSVTLAAKNGCTAIIQPGGSIRDDESIEEANKYNIAMVFTGIRHFKH